MSAAELVAELHGVIDRLVAVDPAGLDPLDGRLSAIDAEIVAAELDRLAREIAAEDKARLCQLASGTVVHPDDLERYRPHNQPAMRLPRR